MLELDVPARLATLDTRGFPHVTPLWFLWTDRAFYFTRFADRPHLRRLAENPRAGSRGPAAAARAEARSAHERIVIRFLPVEIISAASV